MGLSANACPNCGKRGGLAAVSEFGKEKVPGSFCKRCGLFVPDKRSRSFDVSCGDCKKPMGYAAAQEDVVVDGKVIHQGDAPKKFMCHGCSKKRIKAGEHDPDDVLTRYTSKCMGGCGNVQGYIDKPEGDPPPNTDVGYCNACTAKAVEQKKNEGAVDDLVKKVVGPQ